MSHKFDLAALKAKNLPRCTFDALAAAMDLRIRPAAGAAKEDFDRDLAELRASVDKQVAPFIPPQKECIGCGAVLAGENVLEAYIAATFTYGIAHGEGFCGRCGYPARANHYAPEGGVGLNFDEVLQYHPDELEERPREQQAATP